MEYAQVHWILLHVYYFWHKANSPCLGHQLLFWEFDAGETLFKGSGFQMRGFNSLLQVEKLKSSFIFNAVCASIFAKRYGPSLPFHGLMILLTIKT